MNTIRTATAGAALLAVLAGCGTNTADADNNDNDPAATATESTTTSGTTAETANNDVDADAFLLTLDDMPDGWAPFNTPNRDPVCGNPTPDTTTAYSQDPTHGPAVAHGILTGPDDYQDTVDALMTCDAEGDDGGRWNIIQASGAGRGERSTLMRATITYSAGQELTGDILVFEQDGITSMLMVTTTIGSARQSGLLTDFGEIAESRLIDGT